MSDEHDQQREDEIPWLPPGMAAVDAADIDGPGDQHEDMDLEEADEPEDDEDEDFLESYGADFAAPRAPPPLQQAREFQRQNPSAKLDLIFPPIFSEDRGQLVRDALALEGTGVFSRHRVSNMLAGAFDADGFDFETEQEIIRQERARFGGEQLGSGDGLARRVAGGVGWRRGGRARAAAPGPRGTRAGAVSPPAEGGHQHRPGS